MARWLHPSSVSARWPDNGAGHHHTLPCTTANAIAVRGGPASRCPQRIQPSRHPRPRQPVGQHWTALPLDAQGSSDECRVSAPRASARDAEAGRRSVARVRPGSPRSKKRVTLDRPSLSVLSVQTTSLGVRSTSDKLEPEPATADVLLSRRTCRLGEWWWGGGSRRGWTIAALGTSTRSSNAATRPSCERLLGLTILTLHSPGAVRRLLRRSGATVLLPHGVATAFHPSRTGMRGGRSSKECPGASFGFVSSTRWLALRKLCPSFYLRFPVLNLQL